MNPRLIKEFRALSLPWLAGLAAGLAMLAPRAQDYAVVAAVGCAALLAAMSMGNEFQQRTFALLLSQPCARRDLWREKLLVLGTLAGTLCAALLVNGGIAGSEAFRPHDMVMTGIFCLAVVCSASLWTLVTRSIIGGMVFSLAGTLLLLLVTVQLGVVKILGPRFENGIPDAAYAWAWLITGIIYSGACLFAGWRKFARLELRDAILGESTLLSTTATRGSRWRNCLRMRPRGRLRNLFRKELRLQKPILVVAAVFSMCWLAALGLQQLGPVRGYESLPFAVLTFVYIALSLALAGSISLGEERTLGVAAWHLTLPVSARLQWLLKLVVGVCVAIGLGLVLPGLLALATLPEARAGVADMAHRGGAEVLGIATALWLFFVASFWAATLLGSTMRAVFTAVLGIGALGLCTVLSGWLAEQIGGLQRNLLCDITARGQLPLGFFDVRTAVPWGFIAGGFILSLAALAQSLVQFRRAQVPCAVAVKCTALLLAIAFLAAFWCADFRASAYPGYDEPLCEEVSCAVRALPYTETGRPGFPGFPDEVRITEKDLEKVFPLSARTRRWLSGASLNLSWVQVEVKEEPRRFERHGYMRTKHFERHGCVGIKFPNGSECSFDYGTWRKRQ